LFFRDFFSVFISRVFFRDFFSVFISRVFFRDFFSKTMPSSKTTPTKTALTTVSTTASFGLSKLSTNQLLAVFDATVEHNQRRIVHAAFRGLPGNMKNPKRIFGAHLRFLCPKTMPAFVQRDGETTETTPPNHAVATTLTTRHGHQIDGWSWTKWLTRGAQDTDVGKAEVLEIVVPDPETEEDVSETPTLLAALKTIVRQTIRYATNPTTTPPFPMTFVSTRDDAPVRVGWLTGMENGKVAVWYTHMATGGYMIAGSGKDASQAVARTRNRLLDELNPKSVAVKVKQCKQTPISRHRAYLNAQKEARIRNFDMVLAASART
jgi:hypothetical protein